MSDQAATPEEGSVPEQTVTPAKTMIHVRFAPDGSVTQIGERPVSLTAQQWFDRLSDKAGSHYQALSGGRGIFRLERAEVDALKTAATH